MISIWFPLCLILASPPRCRRSAWPLESLGLGNLTWLEKPWKSSMNGWKMAGQIYHKGKISTLRMASMCITGFNCHCAECEFWSWRADVWRLWRARASAKKYYGHPLADFPLLLGHAWFYLILIKTVRKKEDTDACAIGGLPIPLWKPYMFVIYPYLPSEGLGPVRSISGPSSYQKLGSDGHALYSHSKWFFTDCV